MRQTSGRPGPSAPRLGLRMAPAASTVTAALLFSGLVFGLLPEAVRAFEATQPPKRRFPAPQPRLVQEQGAQSFYTQSVRAWDGQAGDWFGYDLALSGDRMLVGIPYDDLVGGNSGSAGAFEFGEEGWAQRDIIAPTRGARGDYFGMAVAIDGERCVVGAPWNNDRAPHAGAAYIFEWDGEYWYERARLYAENGRANDNFGVSLDIDGERIVVGSRWGDGVLGNTGAAYVFEEQRGEWRQTAQLEGSDLTVGDEFGFRVAIEEDRVAVGAYAQEDQRGAVYLFDHNGSRWEQAVRLTAPEAVAGDCFGLALDISDGAVLIGAPWRDDVGEDSGTVYLYRKGFKAWQLAEAWAMPDARGGEYFGCSVAMDSNAILVGARYGGRSVAKSGAAFLATKLKAGWTEWTRLPRRNAVAEDAFGLAVALSDDHAVVATRELALDGTRDSSGVCSWYSLSPPK